MGRVKTPSLPPSSDSEGDVGALFVGRSEDGGNTKEGNKIV